MQKTPKATVVIPSLDGIRDGNVEKLISDLENQTFKDFELKVIKGVRPNGKARNVGSRDAKGEILIFIDDDIRLGHNKVLDNLIIPLESDGGLAMTGASVRLPEDSRYFQKEYDKIRNFTSPIADSIDYQGKVSHACLAIKKSLFDQVGGERDDLITGTDIDLNARIKNKGYRAAVVPNTWVYHLMPQSLFKLIKEAFNCGFGLAYAVKVVPDTFGLPKIKFTDYTIKTKTGAFIYRIFTTLLRLLFYLVTLRPIHCLFYIFYILGHIYGWVRFKQCCKGSL
jgi:glycosyltransferase involved in cell wall biosynthesis